MDSPELRYLKAMHEVNKKFYAYATLEFATTQGMTATLIEMVKADIILARGYDPEWFQQELLKKLEEMTKGFQTAARDFLSRSEIVETGSENN